jgi:phosphoribosylformylglycinamidine synthase
MQKENVKVLIMTGFGLNCEKETFAAFKQAGATPEMVHLNDLLAGKASLDNYHILAFIGGFSFGDHLGAGTVFANRLKFRLTEPMKKFVADGKLAIGICNGFQTMTRLGLLPAVGKRYFEVQCGLANNDSGVFRDDWCQLVADPESPCIFTRGIERIRLPLRHGEGKFVADPEIIDAIEAGHLAALRYCGCDGKPTNEFPANPNGSINAIAGVTDPTGRLFGLMPHPEAFLSPFNAPDWTRSEKTADAGEGAVIFRNAVDFAAENL